MKNKAVVTSLMNSFYQAMQGQKEMFLKAREGEFIRKFEGSKTEEEYADVLVKLMESIKSSLSVASNGLDMSMPGFRVSAKTGAKHNSDEIDSASFYIRSKIGAKVPYEAVTDLDVKSGDIVSVIYDAFISGLSSLAYIDQAVEVAELVNIELAGIKEEHSEITVDVSFAVTLDDVVVVSITDNSIVFGASVSGILDVSDMHLFQHGDNFIELCRNKEVNAYVNVMSAIQFAPEVIKAGLVVVNKALGSKITRRSDKILRKTYHKKAEFLGKQKAGIGYYCETEKSGDDEVVIFALVEKSEEGYSVILSPFDARTNEKVKLDVLKKLKLK